MGALTFADHFSSNAERYRAFRPGYPVELFEFLGSVAPARGLAWDCGTGNGQAALGLAQYFREVIATDPSRAQIEAAAAHDRVSYRVAPAEESGIADHCVDLVTAAQAAHWFDLERFYREVERVLVPGGIIAAWTYSLCRIAPEIDAVTDRFHFETVHPYWPPERAVVDDAYRSLPFPFAEIPAPPFRMQTHWTAAQFLNYLRTWSAVRYYEEAKGSDPVDLIEERIRTLWGPEEARLEVQWPLALRAGRIP